MKKLVGILVVLALVGLFAMPASAALVNTTFEENSAGAGTWNTTTSNDWDEPDIASGVNWVPSSTTDRVSFGTYTGVTAPEGTQCGRIYSSSTGAYSATLDIASGTNTGTYTMTWYAMQKMQGTGDHVYDNSRVRIRDDAQDVAAQISMYNDSESGTDTYGIAYADSGHQFNKLMNMDYGTWYEFELVLNYGTQKFDFKARENGTTTWTAVTNKDFRESSVSLDQISCITDSGGESDGYWDDINVTPEPATMSLLLLGLPFALRRRRRA
ncbi:MAG: PEP-CTERM sorting domain-containing protein [Phycisphaerae bacterium]|nr:PEP-CTERM sorting domain-containing protein [Phycisphaerae bacterium]